MNPRPPKTHKCIGIVTIKQALSISPKTDERICMLKILMWLKNNPENK